MIAHYSEPSFHPNKTKTNVIDAAVVLITRQDRSEHVTPVWGKTAAAAAGGGICSVVPVIMFIAALIKMDKAVAGEGAVGGGGGEGIVIKVDARMRSVPYLDN